MANSKDKDNAGKLMACDFEVHGNVPKEAFELFALAQAKLIGLRGYIMQVSETCFKGQLQGESALIEAFRKLLETAGEFVAAIKEIVIKNLKVIQDYTYQNFDIKKK